jgi:hypothetical protein
MSVYGAINIAQVSSEHPPCLLVVYLWCLKTKLLYNSPPWILRQQASLRRREIFANKHEAILYRSRTQNLAKLYKGWRMTAPSLFRLQTDLECLDKRTLCSTTEQYKRHAHARTLLPPPTILCFTNAAFYCNAIIGEKNTTKKQKSCPYLQSER